MTRGAWIWHPIVWVLAAAAVLLTLSVLALDLALDLDHAKSKPQAEERADAMAAQYAGRLAGRLSKGPVTADELMSSDGFEHLAVYGVRQTRGQAEVSISVQAKGDGIGGASVLRCYVVKVSGVGRPNPGHKLTELATCPAPPSVPTPTPTPTPSQS